MAGGRLTMKEMREKLAATGKYTERDLVKKDRESLELLCGRLGINVLIRKTDRMTYENILGYDFGGWVFQAILLDGSTKQFYFEKFEHEQCVSSLILNYKDFREYINKFDYPKRRSR